MKAVALTGMVVLTVAALGGTGRYLWQSRYSPEARIIEQVRASLIDPESAQFKDVRASPELMSGCGEVNARNHMGGYIGYTRFIAFPDGKVLFKPRGDDGISSLDDRIDRLQRAAAFLLESVATCPRDDATKYRPSGSASLKSGGGRLF